MNLAWGYERFDAAHRLGRLPLNLIGPWQPTERYQGTRVTGCMSCGGDIWTLRSPTWELAGSGELMHFECGEMAKRYSEPALDLVYGSWAKTDWQPLTDQDKRKLYGKHV